MVYYMCVRSSLKTAEVCRNNAIRQLTKSLQRWGVQMIRRGSKKYLWLECRKTDLNLNVRVYIVMRQKWRNRKFTVCVGFSKNVRYEKPCGVTGTGQRTGL